MTAKNEKGKLVNKIRCIKCAENIIKGDRFEHPAGVFRASEPSYRQKDRTDSSDHFIEVPIYQGGFVAFEPGERVRVLKEEDLRG